jgi:ClpP class serine protease
VCGGDGVLKPPPDSDDDEDDRDGEESSSSSSPAAGAIVRVVQVRGVLATEVTDWGCGVSDGYHGPGGIVDRCRTAGLAPDTTALVLDVMSPGGDAMGCGEAAAELAALRDEMTALGRPLLVFVREATSAAFYLAACAAGVGGLFATASADVANVGTRTWHVDRSKANEIAGETVTHIGDPPGKILGNPDEPLDPEALRRITAGITETTGRFYAAVASARGLEPEALRKLDADTRRGEAAVDERLIDGLAGSLAEVVALAHARAVAVALARPAAAPVSLIPSTGAPGAPPPPPSPEDSMKLTPAALAALGLAPGASSAAIETAILTRSTPPAPAPVGQLDVTTDPVRVLGTMTLAALGGDALAALVRAPDFLAGGKVAPATAAENDALRRVNAWANTITSGALTAGWVWKQVTLPNGERGREYTDQAAAWNAAYADVGQLEQALAKLPKLAGAGGAAGEGGQRADPTIANRVEDGRGLADSMTEGTAALAKRKGVDPGRLAQMTDLLFSHMGVTS